MLAFDYQGKTYRSTRREGYLRPKDARKAAERLAKGKKILHINPEDPTDAVEVKTTPGFPSILTLSGLGLILLGVAVIAAGLLS